MTSTTTVELGTPNGHRVEFVCREGTNDENICRSLTLSDEYKMRGRSVSGTVIDIGAHLGAWAISVALDHPDVQVIAVEAVPDNCDLLEQNIALNRVADRVRIVKAAAAAPGQATSVCHWGYKFHESADPGYVEAHRFVGNTWASLAEPEFGGEMDAVSLDDLLGWFSPEVSLLKIDCEGCEWHFLNTAAISHVQEITGEYHGGYTADPEYVPEPAQRIRALLEPTHDLTITRQDPSIGLFEAVRRG